MVNDLRVEELLIQTNPVLDPEELRLSASEVDARCASILERRGAMQTQTPTEQRAIRPGEPRRWGRPALAFMISLFVVLVAAGGVALLVGGGDSDVIDDPVVTTAATTTPTTPTTVPDAVSEGVVAAPSYADVPPFTGTVQYYEHDPALGDPGWRATVRIKHAGPMLYEAEVLTEQGEFLPLGGPGGIFLGDGSASWLNEFEGMPLSVLSDFDHFSHLYFDAQRPYPAWDEICGQGADALGTEALLGRSVTHVACFSAMEDYELWVDEDSGLVLKMVGPLGIGDFSPPTDRDGGFVFTELDFGPVTIPPPPEVATAQTGEFPPFHMIRNEWPGVREYWYRDAGTLRETFIDAEDAGWIGTFTLISDGRLAGCSTHPEEPGCYDVPLEEADDVYPIAMPYSQVPLSLVEESCTGGTEATVAGRPARHFLCDAVEFPIAGNGYYAIDNPGVASEFWYDTETALVVKSIGTGMDVAATLLEAYPAFPVRIFTYEELDLPDPEPSGIEPGDTAPLWSGPLIGGGELDMADYRGRHVVVFNWFPGCGDACLEGLDLMQRMYDQYGDEIEFVTVSEDTESETDRLLNRRSNTVPAVYCVAGEGVVEIDPACMTPVPGVDPWDASPWFLWRNSIPSTTVLDADGVVLEVFTGALSRYEVDLEALLVIISAG